MQKLPHWTSLSEARFAKLMYTIEVTQNAETVTPQPRERIIEYCVKEG